MRGKFIAVYGINNIGKSTHCKRIVKRLEEEGHKAVYVKYPVYDIEPSGPFLDNALRGGGNKLSEEELQMWFILNRYQFQPELERLLNDGYIVVAEDYIGTGIAWGTAKGLDEAWLENANSLLLKEDFSLMLEGSRSLAAKEKGHLHEDDDELAEKCRVVHEFLAEKFNWNVVRVQEKKAATAKLVWEEIEKALSV